jgi:hypothetical protein
MIKPSPHACKIQARYETYQAKTVRFPARFYGRWGQENRRDNAVNAKLNLESF